MINECKFGRRNVDVQFDLNFEWIANLASCEVTRQFVYVNRIV